MFFFNPLIINTKFEQTNFNYMEKLLVRTKEGVEREMTQKAYDLIGYKRKPTIIGKVKPKVEQMSELEIAKQKLRDEKAQQLSGEPKETEKLPEIPKQEVKTEKAKPGPKPKTV